MAERRSSDDCGHPTCLEPRWQEDPLAQYCHEPDEIVASMFGFKLRYGGRQWGEWTVTSDDIREQPAVMEMAKAASVDRMARRLNIPPEHVDADFRARFTWIVKPMTQAEWDDYCDVTGMDDA